MAKNVTATAKMPSKKRIILLKGISMILVPLLILFLVELCLRVFSYGKNFELFVEYKENKDYLVFNPDASKKYFTEQEIAPKGNSEIFKKKKDANTIRLFVLGESTTIGYPYFHNGSFHRWLQYRLTHLYPDKNFEIINLSLTAVNSYTVLGFAKEVVKYSPDAVLVYTGHNEYYGALGAASTQNLGSNPQIVNFILKLRDLKLAQLVTNIYGGLKRNFSSAGSKAGEGRMQLMVATEKVPYKSDLYQKGAAQFANNMAELMALFSEKHIPLFVSSLVSNEKNLQPFISIDPEPAKATAFKADLLSGQKCLTNGKLDSASVYLKKAEQLFGGYALCSFTRGQLAFKQNNFASAKKYFLLAKEQDCLRFRAPEQFNTILTTLSKKYPAVHLVDAHMAFKDAAPHRLIGDELTVDHVHPNLKGYAILSDAFYNALIKYHILPPTTESEITFNQLLQKMPKSPVDSIAGVYRVLNLKKKWPYNDAHAMDSVNVQSQEETLAYKQVFENAGWGDTMDYLYNFYSSTHQLIKARSVLENLALEYPADADIYQRMAMLSGELHDPENIVFNFRRSFNLLPSFDKARYLFVNYLQMDRPAAALPFINYAMSNNTSGFDLTTVKKNTEQLVDLQRHYRKDTANVVILTQIMQAYADMGNHEGVFKYANKTLKIDPQNKAALQSINNNSKLNRQ